MIGAGRREQEAGCRSEVEREIPHHPGDELGLGSRTKVLTDLSYLPTLLYGTFLAFFHPNS